MKPDLINISLNIATPIISSLAILGLHKLYQKLKLNVSNETDQQLQALVALGINAAEEWARTKQKAGMTVTSAEKLDRAITYVTDHDPKAEPSKVADLVHGTIADLGLGASH